MQAVHTHSLSWGWLLNVLKSVVMHTMQYHMVLGKWSECARLVAPELWWGAVYTPRTQ